MVTSKITGNDVRNGTSKLLNFAHLYTKSKKGEFTLKAMYVGGSKINYF